MGWLFHIKYYKNMTIWHDIGRFFSYQSHTFSTRIFQELLILWVGTTQRWNPISLYGRPRSPIYAWQPPK